MSRAERRIQKELEKFCSESDDGLDVRILSANQWVVSFNGPAPLYAGLRMSLRVTFGTEYPMDSPEVMFIEPSIPVHPHIYSNGHICLNILGSDWSPALTAKSVCMSILSMLSSATEKTPPIDNDRYVRMYSGRSPKETNFLYHDDTV